MNRSNLRDTDVQLMGIGKSLFNLSHKSNTTKRFAKQNVTMLVNTMPSDKVTGNSSGVDTFINLTTPVIGSLKKMGAVFYLPFRAMDKDFENFMTPRANNSMSASLHTPYTSLADIVGAMLEGEKDAFALDYPTETAGNKLAAWIFGLRYVNENNLSWIQYNGGAPTAISQFKKHIATIKKRLDVVYAGDYLDEWVEAVEPIITAYYALANPTPDESHAYCYNMLDAFCRMYIGETSLLEQCGCPSVDRCDYDRLVKAIEWGTDDDQTYYEDFSNQFSTYSFNEYPFRMYFAIWYEYLRNINIEITTSAIESKWWYKNWDSSSLLSNSSAADLYPWVLLALRPAYWDADAITSSMPDDTCRHIFAPILDVNKSTSIAGGNIMKEAEVGQDKERRWISETINYTLPDGTAASLAVPFPTSFMGDAFLSIGGTTSTQNALGLDLLTIKRAKMLESYLKRNFYFGDEYRDRMLAHFNVRVSDMRINRPELIGGYVEDMSATQQVANVGTDQNEMGDRQALLSHQSTGGDFNVFCEEFGLIMTIETIQPEAQYKVLNPAVCMISAQDVPYPEFANQCEEVNRVAEFSRPSLVGDDQRALKAFGHKPYAHKYRERLNEVHGDYLSIKSNYTFARFFGLDSDDTTPRLSPHFLHCYPSLQCFSDSFRLYPKCYGQINNGVYVERTLPTPVEVC